MSSKREEIERSPPCDYMNDSDWQNLLDTYFQERLKDCRAVVRVSGSGYHARDLSVYVGVELFPSKHDAIETCRTELISKLTNDLSWIDSIDIDTCMEELNIKPDADVTPEARIEIDETSIRSVFKTKILINIRTMDLESLQELYNTYVLDQKLDKYVDSVVTTDIVKAELEFSGYGIGD